MNKSCREKLNMYCMTGTLCVVITNFKMNRKKSERASIVTMCVHFLTHYEDDVL